MMTMIMLIGVCCGTSFETIPYIDSVSRLVRNIWAIAIAGGGVAGYAAAT